MMINRLSGLNGDGTLLGLLEPEKVEKKPELDDGGNDNFDKIFDDDDDDDDDGDAEEYLRDKVAVAIDPDSFLGEGKIILRKDPNNKERVLIIGFFEGGIEEILEDKEEMWEGDIILAPERRNGGGNPDLKKMSLSEMVAAGGLKRHNWKKKVDG